MTEVLCSLLLVCTATLNPPQPAAYTFKGASLGMGMEEFRRAMASPPVMVPMQVQLNPKKKKLTTQYFPVSGPFCVDTPEGRAALLYEEQLRDEDIDWIHGTVCGISQRQMTAGGEKLGALLYVFHGGKLAGVTLSFQSASYEIIKAAFEAKYGNSEPGERTQFQNVYGARWSGETAQWINDTQRIYLMQGGSNNPAGGISYGGAMIVDMALLPKTPGPAKDF